eukprot:125901-Rhodomonas_salina.5
MQIASFPVHFAPEMSLFCALDILAAGHTGWESTGAAVVLFLIHACCSTAGTLIPVLPRANDRTDMRVHHS